MKTILAYGDSLTWGMNATTLQRHALEDQWPAALEAALGGQVRVINAGLNGRTTMFDDHSVAADRNGARVLPTVLATFDPIDLVVLMLGTNDLKTFICGSAIGAGQGVKRLIDIVRRFPYEGGRPPPQVVVVAPPNPEKLGPSPELPLLPPRSGEPLAPVYAEIARTAGSAFFDAASVASVAGGGDGIHLDAANTRAIGRALAPVAARLLAISIPEAA